MDYKCNIRCSKIPLKYFNVTHVLGIYTPTYECIMVLTTCLIKCGKKSSEKNDLYL